MHKLSTVINLINKIARAHSQQLVKELENLGYNDLRASFLDILVYLSENQNPSIKQVASFCGLKKQTMTSHLNELEKRGYIQRKPGLKDKREVLLGLTEYGQKFKLNLEQVIQKVEQECLEQIGSNELERLSLSLENYHTKIF